MEQRECFLDETALLGLLTTIVMLERCKDGGPVHQTVESGLREAVEIMDKVEAYLGGWRPDEWEEK